ncbi:cache domain-containing sensor histidine kinase [Aquibacillus kalidii]|uniref:cache domain-containing sensor histidine kinase n=1 Tax=Aquibacillus kalidii TaxID=2762597 RepID=UPI001644DC70|nr:sensor histidine kinase [Aquibacillus kalidii]
MRLETGRSTPLSFRSKVILTSVICIVIPVVITLGIYNFLTRDAVKDQAILNANNELKLTGEYVSKLLDDMLYVTNFIQLDSEINSILKARAKTPLNENENGNQSYNQFISDKTVMKTIENITLVGEKSYVTILLTNGKYYTNYEVNDYDPLRLFEEEWFNDLKAMHGYESIWFGSQPTIFESEKKKNPYQISVARTLRNGSSQIYGYVVVTILENKINQIFENRDSTNGEEVFLLDSNNVILSHNDTARIGQTFSTLKKMKSNSLKNVVNISGKDYLITVQEEFYTDWKLVSLIPYRNAISEMNAIYNKVSVLQLVLFAVFFGLLAILINRITRPLVILGNVVSKVRKGNLTIRSKINSKDEIGTFSKSFDEMLDKINEMIKEITDTQSRQRKAELAMLQAQINPHFLFNVLNSIRMKVFKGGDKESAKMISSLSKLLRMTIESDEAIITLYDEVSMVKDYVQLMNMRHRGNVNLRIDVSNEAYEQKVPRLILQPIIENSIIHGFSQHTGDIHLHARVDDDKFKIIIEDNGEGMDEETKEKLQRKISSHDFADVDELSTNGFSSIGLVNVYERMVMSFGTEFEMTIESKKDSGSKITLLIPRGGSKHYV